MEQKKINSLQLLRAIAVSLVILIHASYFGVVKISSVNPIDSLYNLKSWGAIGVDLFFAISGFIMTIVAPSYVRQGGWKTFLIKRVIRIIPLYYLVSAFEVFKVLFVNHLKISLSSVIKTLIFFPIFDKDVFKLPILGVGWSLSYEIYFYALVCLVLVLKKDIFRNLLIIIGILSTVGFFLDPANPLLKFLLSPMLLEFGFGILAGLFYEKIISGKHIPRNIKVVSVLLSVLGLSLMCVTIFITPKFNINYQAYIENNNKIALYRVLVWGVPSALFMSGVIVFENIFNKKIAGFLILAGDASYSCYLIHTYILLATASVFKHFALSPIAYLLLIIPICQGVSIIFYKVVEKTLVNKINKLMEIKSSVIFKPNRS